ncbi:MAG TPA: IS200/IS605 family transposase [Ktedonobacterales bacterium]|jgi:putative transposase
MTNGRVYYHVTFTVTRGKPVFLNEETDAEFKRLASEIAHRKGWTILELETMPNHVHVLIEKAPWQELPRIVNDLKGISARRLLQRFDWLRGDLGSFHFWIRGYHYVRHTDATLATVRAYIRNQRRAGGLTE